MKALGGSRRGVRALAAVAIAAAALVIVASGTSGAVTVQLSCDAWLWANGSYDTSQPPVQADVAQDLTFGSLSGPPEVNAGSSFKVTTPSVTRKMPTQQDSVLGPVTVTEVKNIVTKFEVNGAASIGALSTSAGNVINPTLTRSGNVLTLRMPGSQTPSQIPAGGPPGNAFFPGGSNLVSPKLTVNLTAGAAGTTISAKVTRQEFDVIVDLGGTKLGSHLICTPAGNSLGSIPVVTPPPPGAPDAVADSTTTDQGKAVTVEVLANDKADDELAIDTGSLAIAKRPGHGSAVVNADKTVTYTPQGSFSGTDSFEYQLCSLIPPDETDGEQQEQEEVEVPAEQEPVGEEISEVPCDVATVTVAVNAPVTPTTQGTTATTRAPAPPSSDVTVLGGDELPRTGSTSGPSAALGVALCVLGALVLASMRRRPAL